MQKKLKCHFSIGCLCDGDDGGGGDGDGDGHGLVIIYLDKGRIAKNPPITKS